LATASGMVDCVNKVLSSGWIIMQLTVAVYHPYGRMEGPNKFLGGIRWSSAGRAWLTPRNTAL